MDKKIEFVRGDDWEGMYIDGWLAVEDHRLSQAHILDALGIPYEWKQADDGWIEARGNLPMSLACVVVDG